MANNNDKTNFTLDTSTTESDIVLIPGTASTIVSGNVQITSTLSVTSKVNFDNTLNVSSAVTFHDVLNVSGNTKIEGDVTIGSRLHKNKVDIKGNVAIGKNVAGLVEAAESGALIEGTVVMQSTLSVSKAVAFNSSLSVTGGTFLESTLS